MPLYEVTLRSTYVNQQMVNRWNYVSGGTAAATSISFGLVAALGFINGIGPGTSPTDSFFAALKSIQADTVFYNEVEARNIYDPTDFYLLPFLANEKGDTSGEAMPPFVAIGFRTNRTRTDIRRATKRFSGIPETAFGSGGTLGGTIGTNCVQVAARMSEVIDYDDEGNSLTFTPVVVQKEKYTTSNGTEAYRYYDTLEEQLTHLMTSITWQTYLTARSQVSRQYGRGL